MRATTARRKEEKEKGKEGMSSLAPKVVGKGVPKRKSDGKDDRPPKKVSATPRDKPPKKSSPLKSSHEADKGLMMTLGPITQGSVLRLRAYKEHVVEVIKSIIKDTDMDPCVEHMTKELGALGLFDLAWVRLFFSFFFLFIYYSIADGCSVCRRWSV